MKIMYIGFEGFDTKNGTNHLIKTLIRHLIIEHEIIYVNSHSEGYYDDIPYDFLISNNFRSFIINKKKVNKRKLIKRFYIAQKYGKDIFKCILNSNFEADLIILQSTPTAYQIFNLINPIVKSKIILNSYDVFPDGIKKLQQKRFAFIRKYFEYKQKTMYKKLDHIICNSYDVQDTFIKKGINISKLTTIYNWYNQIHSINITDSENRFMRNNNLSRDKFIIQYAGNFGFTFNHTLIIDLALQLKKNNNIVFHMIGEGAKLKEFKEDCLKAELNNVIFYNWQNEDIIADVYNACDIQIIPLEDNVIYYSFPSKISLTMSLGKIPMIITEKNSRFTLDLITTGLNICFEKSEIMKLSDNIIALYEDTNKYQTYSKLCRDYAFKNLSSNVNLEKFDLMLNDLIKG